MVICKVCNKEFKMLVNHLIKMHKLAKEQYLKIFPESQVNDEEVLRKMREKRILWMSDPINREVTSQKTKEAMTDEICAHISKKQKQRLLEDPLYKEKCILNLTKDGNPSTAARKYWDSEKDKSSRNAKIGNAKKQWWKVREGLTLEEIIGPDKAKKIINNLGGPKYGKDNPAFGKVFEKQGRINGYYKGILFRSLYKYSFLKLLEQEGFNINDPKQVQYEKILIEYIKDNKERTYRPDFILCEYKYIIEIKSVYHLKLNNNDILLKKEAAEKWCIENGYKYKFYTENDFKVYPYSIARIDPDIIWIHKPSGKN